MALSVGNTTTASGNTASSISFAHNNNGNFLILNVSGDNDAAAINTVTYNGEAMFKWEARGNVSVNYYVYQLVNPSQGSNNIVISFLSGGVDDSISAVAISFINADTSPSVIGNDETDPSREFASGDSAGPAQVTITSSAKNSIIVDCVTTRGMTLTVDGSQTQVMNIAAGAIVGGSSYKKQVSPAGVTMSWTLGTSGRWIVFAFEVREKSLPKTVIF